MAFGVTGTRQTLWNLFGHFINDHESREFYFLVSIGIFDIVFPHAESEKKRKKIGISNQVASKYYQDPLARRSPVVSAPALATKEVACLIMEVWKSPICYELTGRAVWGQNSPHVTNMPCVYPYRWLVHS